MSDVRDAVIAARVALAVWQPKNYALSLLARKAMIAIREFLLASEINGEPPIVEYYNENRCLRVKTTADDRKWLSEMRIKPFRQQAVGAI